MGLAATLFARRIANPLRHQREEVRRATETLTTVTSQVAASVSQLAASVQEVAASVNETTATTEQVKQMGALSSEKARHMEENARRSSQVAAAGVRSTDETIARMRQLQEQIAEIAGRMVKLSERSQAIGQITIAVGDLADQSNLLAVNAAIEAAKAGEHGRGFAVVAQEVRLLAERSKAATAEIRTILGDIERSTSAAVLVTEQGTRAVEAGMKQASDTGEIIRNLARNIDETALAASQIVASSRQQVIGMDQTAQAMESIKLASSQNAAGSNQLRGAAASLNAVTDTLGDLIQALEI